MACHGVSGNASYSAQVCQKNKERNFKELENSGRMDHGVHILEINSGSAGGPWDKANGNYAKYGLCLGTNRICYDLWGNFQIGV